MEHTSEHPEYNKESLVVITEDSEFFIIDTGNKKRYVPKREYIPVNGINVKTSRLIKALSLYPDDGPASALEKLKNEHPEINE